MDVTRITSPVELFSCREMLYPLFEGYYAKAKLYVDDIKAPADLWRDCVINAMFPDYYFYVIREDNEFIGFMSSCLMRMPQLTVLYMMDYYIPNRGLEFLGLLKEIVKMVGADEVWGEAPDRVYNGYKRSLKDAVVIKKQLVRITF